MLLFLGVVALGGISRFCHFSLGTKLDAVLFKKPLTEIDKILICGKDTTIVNRTSEQWLISQKDEVSVLPDSVVQALLVQIGQIQTVQLLHSSQPDTLGLSPTMYRTLVCLSNHWEPQIFYIGKTTLLQGIPFTWIALPLHDQFYMVKGDLNTVFDLEYQRYVPKVLMQTDTSALQSIRFLLKGDTLFDVQWDSVRQYWTNYPFGKKDTIGMLKVEQWKKHWQNIGKTAVNANFFDKRSAAETFCGEIRFHYQQIPQSVVNYRLFYVRQPVLPDDPEKMRYFRNFKPQYLFESDLQPGFYFAVTDTFAIYQLKYLIN